MATSVSRKSNPKKSKKKKPAHTWTDSRLWNSKGDSANETEFRDWGRYLKSRKRRQKSEKILKTTVASALFWMVDDDLRERLCPNQFPRDQRYANAAVARVRMTATDDDASLWVASLADRTATPIVALGALVWSHALIESCAEMSVDGWRDVLDSLLDLSGPQSTGGTDVGAWVEQLLSVELPLTLAWQFPEIERCSELAKTAVHRLCLNMLSRMDGEGVIHGDHYHEMGPLAASWTRCLAMTRDIRGVKPDKGAREEYDWMIRNLIRLSRDDGELSLSPPCADAEQDWVSSELGQLIKSGLRITEDEEDIAITKLRWAGKKIASSRLPTDVSIHSEWSGVSVMQANWRGDEPRLVVHHSDEPIRVELEVAKSVLFSTAWCPEILIDGEPIRARNEKDPWEAVCWYADEESDYLELNCDLFAGWTLQRQFLLGKSERFLLACDYLINEGDVSAALDYRLTIPLAEGVAARQQKNLRDGLLQSRGKKHLATVLPLALPEWTDATNDGEFHAGDGAIRLNQSRKGRALSAPLFFDLDGSRAKASRTWRHLTVAQSRRIVTRDEAVGYRIQVGGEQWMMYRSLTEVGNRTLIGQNLSSDFVFARLTMDGTTEPLVEIE